MTDVGNLALRGPLTERAEGIAASFNKGGRASWLTGSLQAGKLARMHGWVCGRLYRLVQSTPCYPTLPLVHSPIQVISSRASGSEIPTSSGVRLMLSLAPTRTGWHRDSSRSTACASLPSMPSPIKFHPSLPKETTSPEPSMHAYRAPRSYRYIAQAGSQIRGTYSSSDPS